MPDKEMPIYKSEDYRADPDISVIIPAYNHQKFVHEAIQSVIAQTYRDIELIIVDDGSTDSTLDVCVDTAKENDRINVTVYSRANQGAHAAINFGIAHSSGEFVTILNSDDTYLPQRLDVLRFALLDNEAMLAFSKIRCIDENAIEILPSDPTVEPYIRKQNHYLDFPTIGFALLEYNIAITTGNLFFTRQLFDAIGAFRAYRYCHDWDFILSSLIYADPVFVVNELYQYRLHGENTFLQLGAIADQEVNEILQRFFSAERSAHVDNPRFPSPENFGDAFGEFMRAHGYEKYLPG